MAGDREEGADSGGVVLVSFPGAPYTQGSALAGARKVFQAPSWRIADGSPEGGDVTATDEDNAEWVAKQAALADKTAKIVYLMDYDLIPFESVQTAPQTATSSSYCIRKALIRKNWLHTSVHAYDVKHEHKGSRRPLDCLPKTWSIDVQFADDLDELLIDDLYDLAQEMEGNDQRPQGERKWWIIKAAMADRGMGIRLFNSIDGLREILEEFEASSDDDDDEQEEDEDEDEATGDSDLPNAGSNAAGGLTSSMQQDTAVMLSQLRHFVIQEYVNPPLLICPNPVNRPDSFRKFHLRAYVLCVGGLQVFLWDEMLALFAPSDYASPKDAQADSDEPSDPTSSQDPRIHLTNTCLHADGSATADGRMEQENVHLLSDLCADGSNVSYAAKPGSGTDTAPIRLGPADLARLRQLAAETVALTFEAAAKGSGSTNWLMWDNCWEIFGVDLLVGWDSDSSADAWKMWLLEVNAQPDFAQTGPRLQGIIDDLFQRSLEIAVKGSGRDAGDVGQSVGQSREGMTLCFNERLRGTW
ncbi:unnamed protein product [Parajaminaea phylloscopi]